MDLPETNVRKQSNWCNKKLSQAGKEVLLKAITMSMTTYALSCFKLPVKLCKDIHALMARFLWGEDNGKRKVHWCSWKKMASGKHTDGIWKAQWWLRKNLGDPHLPNPADEPGDDSQVL